MKTTVVSDGEEVSFVNDLIVNQGDEDDGGDQPDDIFEDVNVGGQHGNEHETDFNEQVHVQENQQTATSDADDERNFSSSDSDDPDIDMPTGPSYPNSSYRDSSQSNHILDDKVDGEEVSSVYTQPFYDPHCDHTKLGWKEGMRFTTPTQFKEAVVMYSIAVGYEINWKRSNKVNKEAVCKVPGCKWRVFASWFGRNEAFTVKGVGQPHNCPRAMINRSATASWIAKNFIGKFRIYPNMEPEQILQEVKAAYDIDVSLKVCSNAKAEAKKMLEGTLIESYKKLRAYILQLKKSDPEGKFVVEVEPVAGQEYVHFQRMYVGFSCLKKGFLNGCRKFFALDGCFLKGEVKGMILSAVAKDGTNQMFPIAWAVVESENRSSWLWFVSLLQEELNLYDGTGWSVISDQQKVNLYVYIAYFG
ncbi:hypothetical protein LINGRAPRIM_LOCUS415 [Linum grandiflorum]